MKKAQHLEMSMRCIITAIALAAAALFADGCSRSPSALTSRPAAQGDEPPTDERYVNTPKKQDQEKEKEPFTDWGTEVNGLQAGLGFLPGEQGVRSAWGLVTLVVRVRNVSMKEVVFQYSPESEWTGLPDVTDAKGKATAINGGFLPVNVETPKEVSLAPGKSIELWQWKLNVRPESESTKPPPVTPPYATVYGPGKFIVQYPWVIWSLKPPNTWAKLATGKLEVEIRSEPPPATKAGIR